MKCQRRSWNNMRLSLHARGGKSMIVWRNLTLQPLQADSVSRCGCFMGTGAPTRSVGLQVPPLSPPIFPRHDIGKNNTGSLQVMKNVMDFSLRFSQYPARLM